MKNVTVIRYHEKSSTKETSECSVEQFRNTTIELFFLFWACDLFCILYVPLYVFLGTRYAIIVKVFSGYQQKIGCCLNMK